MNLEEQRMDQARLPNISQHTGGPACVPPTLFNCFTSYLISEGKMNPPAVRTQHTMTKWEQLKGIVRY